MCLLVFSLFLVTLTRVYQLHRFVQRTSSGLVDFLYCFLLWYSLLSSFYMIWVYFAYPFLSSQGRGISDGSGSFCSHRNVGSLESPDSSLAITSTVCCIFICGWDTFKNSFLEASSFTHWFCRNLLFNFWTLGDGFDYFSVINLFFLLISYSNKKYSR